MFDHYLLLLWHMPWRNRSPMEDSRCSLGRAEARPLQTGWLDRLGGALAGEEVDEQGDQGEQQKQMNQEACDMVHDKTADPGEQQQDGDRYPNEPTHRASTSSIQYELSGPINQLDQSAGRQVISIHVSASECGSFDGG